MIFIENQADNLAAKIGDVISLLVNNETDAKKNAIISATINELIRNEHIILPIDSVIECANRYATIDPGWCIFDVPPIKNHLYVKIHANSFGPFNPDKYFNINRTHRILWLLKEPYIKLQSWYDGDRGCHNQAGEYRQWEAIKEENYSLIALIEYSRKLLEQLGIVYTGKNEAEIMEKYMGHICIIEANHFPGLAFNKNESNDSLVKKWYKINQNLLKVLVDFYDPQILIGGGTFNNFIDEDFNIVANNIKNEKLFIFGDLIENWSYVTRKDQKDQIDIEIPNVIGTIPDGAKDVLKNIKYKGNKRYYIQTNHPSYTGFKPDFAEKFDGPTILRWMNS